MENYKTINDLCVIHNKITKKNVYFTGICSFSHEESMLRKRLEARLDVIWKDMIYRVQEEEEEEI